MTLLDIRGLCVDLPIDGRVTHPVRDVTLDLSEGETLCVVGESGSGKTMTALAIADLLPAGARRRARQIRLGERDLAALSRRGMNRVRGSEITMIFQDPTSALDPCRTIGYHLEEIFHRHQEGGRSVAQQRVCELLERVGISSPLDRLRQYPHQLSGGLRQRVMIAMALISNPRLVIADEPTTALDATTQVEILRLLKELQAERGLSILFITHDFGVVAHVASRVAVMYAGEIVETGTAHEVIADPRHPYTRALLACLPEASPPGTVIPAIRGSVRSLLDPRPGCAFLDRCDQALHQCAPDDIALRPIAPGRTARCVRQPVC